MPDLIAVHLLLLPNIVLGLTSRAGRHAGYYVLSAWIVVAIIAGLYSIAFAVYAGVVLGAAAVLMRDRLRIGEWFAQRSARPGR
jgi:branched-subunit amino acid ABC-type transport system permease component